MPAVHHQLDIFGCHLYLARNTTEWAGIRRRVDNAFGKVNSVGRTEICTNAETGDWVVGIYIEPNLAELDRIETTAHEATHAAAFILSHIGEQDRTHEIEPYLVGWLNRWIHQHLT